MNDDYDAAGVAGLCFLMAAMLVLAKLVLLWSGLHA